MSYFTPAEIEDATKAFAAEINREPKPSAGTTDWAVRIVEAVLLHLYTPAVLHMIEEEVERRTPGYMGTWQPETVYPKNAFVTHSNAIWCAREDTSTEPGDDPFWQLAMRQPKAAR